MPERLTITVAAGGDDAEVRAFMAVVRDTLNALDSLERNRLGEGERPSGWRIVDMDKNSPPSMTIESRTQFALGTLFLAALKNLDAGEPSGLTAAQLRKFHMLGKRIGTVDEADYRVGTESYAPSSAVGLHAKEALGERYYTAETSIDGRLEVVNVHKKYKFTLYDDMDGHVINCRFEDELLPSVIQLLNRRVTVFGTVKYRADDDQAVSIRAEQLEAIGGDEDVMFVDMPVIDLCPGMSSEDYVRQLRDG